MNPAKWRVLGEVLAQIIIALAITVVLGGWWLGY